MSALLRLVAAHGAGVLFGLGLSISGMVDPVRVRGFLDVTGDWDPSLAFVLAGAVIVAFLGVRLSHRLARPLLDQRFDLPTRTRIDRRLVIGSAIFGVGWGLAGFCPGPAVAALSFVGQPALLFVAAMLMGMVVHDRLVAPRLRPGPRAADAGGPAGTGR